MRLFWLVGSLALALLIGVLSLQVPAPAGADAPATAFSAERAMADVRQLAQRPHPVGSHGARDLKRQHADQQRQRERSNQPEQPHETSSPMTRRP